MAAAPACGRGTAAAVVRLLLVCFCFCSSRCFRPWTVDALQPSVGGNDGGPDGFRQTPAARRRDVLPTRRRWIADTASSVAAVAGTSTVALPQNAHAARGAAELDLEFYVRDLIGGNRKEGSIRSSALPILPPPRRLDLDALPLLDDECSSACLSTAALLAVLQSNGRIETDTERTVSRHVAGYRDRAQKSFYARAPWQTPHVSDQYYFDLTSYALWRTAADLLPNYRDRDDFVRRIGRLTLQKMTDNGTVPSVQTAAVPAPPSTVPSSKTLLQDSVPSVLAILSSLQDSGYCKGYRIAGEATRDDPATDLVFDDLDDDSLASGTTVDCLVSIYEPATLGASLQITGEQSRFAPDYAGTTLAAFWETLAVRTSWETFFIDPEYRPNPKDYFPNETLLQMTLRKS